MTSHQNKVNKGSARNDRLRYDRIFLIALILIVVIGSAMRLSVITIRPFHHDEAVLNWYFSEIEIMHGIPYQYDTNYHGPLMFYVTAGLFKLFGISVFNARIVQTIMSCALVFLVYVFARMYSKDKKSVLIASSYTAISPILIYYGSFAFVDSYFLFFWVLSLIFFMRFFFSENKRKKRTSLWLFTLFTSLLFCIKEMIFIFLPIEILMFFVMYYKKYEPQKKSVVNKIKTGFMLFFSAFKKNWLFISGNIGLFLSVIFVFYSNFFRTLKWNPFYFFYFALKNSSNLSETTQGKPFLYYTTHILFFAEPLIFVVFCAVAAYIISDFIMRFKEYKLSDTARLMVVILSIISYFVFSSITYKTNWNVLYLYLPMVFVLPLFFDMCFKGISMLKKYKKNILADAATAAFAIFVAFMFVVSGNMYYYTSIADPANSSTNHLAYVQTSMDIYSMMDAVNASYSSLGSNGSIFYISYEGWPGYWFFRNYKNTYFYNSTKSYINSNSNRFYNNSIYIISVDNVSSFEQNVHNFSSWSSKTYNIRDNEANRVILFTKKKD